MKTIKKQPNLLDVIDEKSYLAQALLVIDVVMREVCSVSYLNDEAHEIYKRNNAERRYRDFQAALKDLPMTRKKFQVLLDEYESFFMAGERKEPGVFSLNPASTTIYQLDKLITQFACCAALWEIYKADGNFLQSNAMFIKLIETYGSIERTRLEAAIIVHSNQVLYDLIQSGENFKDMLIKKERASSNGIKKGINGISKKKLVIEKFNDLEDRLKNKNATEITRILFNRHQKMPYEMSTVVRLISAHKKELLKSL